MIPTPGISEEDIAELLRADLSVRYWEQRLGKGVWYEYESQGKKYSTDYVKHGKELWGALRYELYEVLCLRDETKPREWLNDLVTGDIRNLLLGIATAITSKYDVSLGIVVPCTALIVKTGIARYCGTKPPRKPRKSVVQILARFRAIHSSGPSSPKALKSSRSKKG